MWIIQQFTHEGCECNENKVPTVVDVMVIAQTRGYFEADILNE